VRLLACLLAFAVLLAAGVLAPPAHASPRDQIVVTGGVTVPRGQTVKNVVVVDGPVTIAGHATGHVVAVHGRVTVSGTVDRDVTAVSQRARLLPGARVGGDLLYGGPRPTVAPSAHVAGKISDEGWTDVGTGAFSWLVRLLFWLGVTFSTLVLGLVLLALAPRAAEGAMTIAARRTGAAAGWAAILFFGLPILAVVLMATILGLPLGIGLLLVLLPLSAVGYVTTCWVLGRAVVRGARSRFLVFLAGWGILRAVALIPFLGALVWVVASAFGLALLLLAAWYGGAAGRGQPAGAPAPQHAA
jgi:hypothetical protein